MIKTILVLTAGLAICVEALASEPVAPAVGEHLVRDTPLDFKMPTKLWDIIFASKNSDQKDGGHDKKEEHGGGEKTDTLVVWLPVEVLFTAKRGGILAHDSVQYNLPRGGGTLDLSKITTGDKGTFYLKFNLKEFTNPSALRVYFVSNAKKRRVESDIFGAGCNVYFDVTNSFQKLNSGDGIKFNITNNRHISALGGHFIFAQTDKDKVYLSQVEFNDSKNRDYLCKN